MRFLVVDDDPEWRREVPALLGALRQDVEVDVAGSKQEALGLVGRNLYELAVVDLSLLGGTDLATADAEGLELFAALRADSRNRWTALLLLTGLGTLEEIRRAFQRFAPLDAIDKNRFSPGEFAGRVRAALLSSRLAHAEDLHRSRHRLALALRDGAVVGCELTGPRVRAGGPLSNPIELGSPELARRADELDALLQAGEVKAWRSQARRLGTELYSHLAQEPQVAEQLFSARAQASSEAPLWLVLGGLSADLRLPFELMGDGNDYFCFDHLISRRIVQDGVSSGGKGEAFHSFLSRLVEERGRLRVLLVGADPTGTIPAVEREVMTLAAGIEADLGLLGLEPEVLPLVGDRASYEEVSQELGSGRFHLLHFAGHGRFDGALPESSGMVLRHGHGFRTLRAEKLKLLVAKGELRFVFLSSCFGARTAATAGHGDFLGVLEAFTRAGVPEALGYRWTVSDGGAGDLARAFYHSLWRVPEPALALREARRWVAMENGRDDDTWASPLLVSQSS